MKMRDLAEIQPWDWPPTASVLILEVLRKGDAPSDERELAVELAGDLVVMNDDVAGELLLILENPAEPGPLRAEAAVSFGPTMEEFGWTDGGVLGEWDLPAITEPVFNRAREALQNAYQDLGNPPMVRRFALEASARAPEPWHEDAVKAAYGEEDPEWKLTAVFCMRFVPGFGAEIVEALESDDPLTLLQAVQASRDQAVPKAFPRIRELVRAAASGEPLIPEDPDLDWSLLTAAMHAVAMIRPDQAEELLYPFIDSDDEDIVDAAMEALDVADVFMAEEEGEEDDPATWN